MAIMENMSVRVSVGTLGTIKKFAHENDMSIRVVLDDFAELIKQGYVKMEKGHLTVGSAFKEFEQAAKSVGKDPIVVITSVTEQLRRK